MNQQQILKKYILTPTLFVLSFAITSRNAYALTPPERLLYDGQGVALWSLVGGGIFTALVYAFNLLLSDYKPSKKFDNNSQQPMVEVSPREGLLDILVNDFWISKFITRQIAMISMCICWWIFYSGMFFGGWCLIYGIIDWQWWIISSICAFLLMVSARASLEVAVAIIRIAENTEKSNGTS
jgi:uncharacterized membrane protein